MMRRKILLGIVMVAILASVWVCLIARARDRLPYFHRPGLEYCWLVFGPQARVRLLVRIEGEAVTLEHYEGDTPGERKERFEHLSDCKDVVINDPDGKTSYILEDLRRTTEKTAEPPGLIIDVSITGPVAYREYGDVVRMSRQPKGAPIAHFHGPLTVQVQTINWKVPSGLALRRGSKPTDLRAFVGTFDADKGCWVVVRSEESVGGKTRPAFPSGVHPVVDVEFLSGRPGSPTIKRRYPLDQHC